MANSRIASAQVVLRPTTSAVSKAVMDAFGQAGFAVGDLVANNFSITAPAATFGSFFRVQQETLSGIRSSQSVSARELPLEALPMQIRDKIAHVVFSRPLDFGPGAHF
jgi:hypothetical protein